MVWDWVFLFLFTFLHLVRSEETNPSKLQPYPTPSHDWVVEPHIPKTIWTTMKTFPQPLPHFLATFLKKNSDWKHQLVDDTAADSFMNEVFANTSILWAYKLINPELGAAKADIWRMAALWRYGGCYIDSDAWIQTPLSEVIFLFQPTAFSLFTLCLSGRETDG